MSHDILTVTTKKEAPMFSMDASISPFVWLTLLWLHSKLYGILS